MKTTTVTYGRTIEVGRFGHGRPCGRVWFGWTVELEEGDTEASALATLKERADTQEQIERDEFDARNRKGL